MDENLEASIIRIRKRDGAIVGAGFLVSDSHLVTCAHVIADALDSSDRSEVIPTEEVYLDFPLVAPQYRLTAKVVVWHPVGASPPREDIAILELKSALPSGAKPTVLRDSLQVFGHSLRVCGFPNGYDPGVWAIAQARGHNEYGWIQIGDTQLANYFVKPGFSGSQVWDNELQGTIGMVVAADKTNSVREAWMISTATLRPLLPQALPQAPPAISDIIQVPGAIFDSNWYVPHRSEETVLNYLRQAGAPAILYGPGVCGKTWLLQNILHNLPQQPALRSSRVVSVNMHTLGREAFETFDSLLKALGTEIESAAGGTGRWVEEVWKRPSSSAKKLTFLLEKRILPSAEAPLILAVDKVETIIGQPYQGDFISLLGNLVQSADCRLLRLLLCLSTTPTSLSPSQWTVLFPDVPLIQMQDFDADQLVLLARKHTLDWSRVEIDLLMQLVGGHPYLTRLPMYASAVDRKPLEALLKMPLHEGVFARHLRERHYWINERPNLKEAVCQVLNNPHAHITDEADYLLRRAGLLQKADHRYNMSYPLYDRYFKQSLCLNR
jgi:hypothetical protein